MTVTDASVIVSALWPQDAFHAVSRAWLDHHLLDDGFIVAPTLLRSEVAGAIARRANNPALGHQAVKELVGIPRLLLVPIVDELDELMVNLAAELQLRGADAAYVALAAYLDLPLVTLDREQHERGGRRIDTREPRVSELGGTP